ncbi:MAG TPA: MBL fold metallo-hydrolase [Gemmataceae bacterium]|jgi:beta-lactamase superfamily II metal-dependent hydrolase|nr:MBL fold metallo-hydrolase [Gemmataceae bacterium]
MFGRILASFCILATLALPAGAAPPKGLTIYFIDTEGGAATLIVTPAGESVLIDCGNPGSRDAERIHKTAQEAGIDAIDNLITTHWHVDHYGGVAHLAELMPIRKFYNRGIPDQLPEDSKNFPILIQAYKKASAGKSITLKPGDQVSLKQTAGAPPVRLLCLVASGEAMADAPQAPANPIASEHVPQAPDPSDNARSLGFLLSYGDLRFLDLGDLTWNVEFKLVHPTNKIGLIDVYQSTHHGLEISNNPVLIKSVEPRVAVFNNGPRKGGHPDVVKTLRRVPGIQAIYQMHRNLSVGQQENTDPDLIANQGPSDQCTGEGIRLSVAADGKSYEVLVGHQGKPRRFETRQGGR